MAGETLSKGVDAFASIAQGLMHAAVRHQMIEAYRRDIKPGLVRNLAPGQGALLYLATWEPRAIDLGLVPRQIIFRHLGLIGTGHDPKALKDAFERQPAIWAIPPNKAMVRKMRYIWLLGHQIYQW